MASEVPRGLPEDWPDAFGDEERDYLHDESRRRLRETIEFGDQQEAKALVRLQKSLLPKYSSAPRRAGATTCSR